MTEFIILSRGDILTLCKDEPVTVWIDKRPMLLCSDEYFEKQKTEEQADEEVQECDNHTNGDVFKAMLKKYFPKTLFIWSKNEAYRTMGIVFSEEWFNATYKGVDE